MNEHIALLLHDGFCEEQIYFQLLAPSAHLLIELWGEDRISYVEVTVSLNRLQQVIRNFEGEVPYNGDSQSSRDQRYSRQAQEDSRHLVSTSWRNYFAGRVGEHGWR